MLRELPGRERLLQDQVLHFKREMDQREDVSALVEVLDIQDIVTARFGESQQYDLVDALVTRNNGSAYIEEVITALGIESSDDIASIRIRELTSQAGDVLGSDRVVDRIDIRLQDGGLRQCTVSLDRETVTDVTTSPTYQEYHTLSRLKDVSFAQKVYGMKEIEMDEGVVAMICKEYVPGDVLDDVLREINQQEKMLLVEAMAAVLAESLNTLGGVPKDSNPYNLIAHRAEEGFVVKYCDISDIKTDPVGIDWELHMISYEFGNLSGELIRRIEELCNEEAKVLLSEHLLAA